MSFHDDESADLGVAGQSKLESFLFSKNNFSPVYQCGSVGAHVGFLCESASIFLLKQNKTKKKENHLTFAQLLVSALTYLNENNI